MATRLDLASGRLVNDAFLVPKPVEGGVSLIDANAATFIQAVEAADGQALEWATRGALSEFVTREKAAGRWSSLGVVWVACARTLAGSLIALKGLNPTNNGFLLADYTREGGFLGDGSSKYLNTNYVQTSTPATNRHIAVNLSAAASNTASYGTYIGAATSTGGLFTSDFIWRNSAGNGTEFRLGRGGVPNDAGRASGFHIITRDDDIGTTRRFNNSTLTETSATAETQPSGVSFYIHARNLDNSPANYGDSRINFYSAGADVGDAAAYETSVETLLSALATAIP